MKFTFRKDKYNQYHLYIDNKKIYKWYLYELKSFNNVLYPTHILFLGTKLYQGKPSAAASFIRTGAKTLGFISQRGH